MTPGLQTKPSMKIKLIKSALLIAAIGAMPFLQGCYDGMEATFVYQNPWMPVYSIAPNAAANAALAGNSSTSVIVSSGSAYSP